MRVMCLLLPLMLGASSAALSAGAPIDLRVDKLEKEMHAVQRKVFPNGTPVEPEIVPLPVRSSIGSEATPPLVDITQRVDLVEAQVKTLTGQVEQYNIRLKRLEESFKLNDARIKALEAVPAASVTTAPSSNPPVVTPVKPIKSAKATSALSSPKVKDAPVKPIKDAKREALVAAIAIPDTGDAAEDSYTYAYRLFSAKLYPEAEVKLLEFVTKYPKSKRFTFAQNLLGRSYYEEGKYANAAKAFVDNYTKLPKGERAPESLSWAGSALTKDGLPIKACRVYQEFDDVYGAKAPRDAQDRVAKGRIEAKCVG